MHGAYQYEKPMQTFLFWQQLGQNYYMCMQCRSACQSILLDQYCSLLYDLMSAHERGAYIKLGYGGGGSAGREQGAVQHQPHTFTWIML